MIAFAEEEFTEVVKSPQRATKIELRGMRTLALFEIGDKWNV